MDNEKRLSGRVVAMLVANGFEEAEMTDTQKALVADGGMPRVVSPEIGLANGWHEGTWGHNFYVEVKVSDVLPSQYDALLVPGGDRSIASLLENAHARRIVKGMLEAGKPVGLVSNAAAMLIATDSVAGRRLATSETVREKVEEAGASWTDEAVCIDGNLVTSAGGDHLPAFIEAFLDALDGGAAEARDAA